MKTIILILAIALFFIETFAQTDMVVRTKTGTYTVFSIDDIERIDFAPCGIVDYEGQTYYTVKIGDQCWFTQNLNIGTRINGSGNQTNNSTIEKYCYNDDPNNCNNYGGLYQWAEAVQYLNGATNTTSPKPPFTGNVQGICPPGWHIPTIAELTILKTEVGSHGNTLKAIGQGSGAGAGTNTSGFSALLAGYRGDSGYFDLSNYAIFWSSTQNDATFANFLSLWYFDSSIYINYDYKVNGFSVRCLKD